MFKRQVKLSFPFLCNRGEQVLGNYRLSDRIAVLYLKGALHADPVFNMGKLRAMGKLSHGSMNLTRDVSEMRG